MTYIDQLQYGLMLYTCEEYSANNITVTINWIQQLGLVYNASVTVVPLQEPLMFNESGSSSVQLVLEYNTVYNLSVIMAVASCDANYTEIFITLNYGEAYFFHSFGIHMSYNYVHITQLCMEEYCIFLTSR